MQDALAACKRLNFTAKSTRRQRRPTREELTRLHGFFKTRLGIPMDEIMVLPSTLPGGK